MASVEKRPDGKWRARYRPVPGGRQIARHFQRKIDAERWLTEQQSRVNRGDWTAPELGRIAVSEWAETWLASKKTLKGRTYTSYESVWRTLVKPRWGDTRLDRVTHGEVVRWVAELSERGLSPSRITQALLCLKQVLALAVMDGRLARNAAEHVKPPRPRKAEPRFLTHEQVHDLAEACGQYRVFVLTAAYTGLRWGELRALRVKRIDLEEVELMLLKPCPNGLWSWTRRRTTSAEQCRSLDLSSMSWRSRSNGRGLMISCLLTQQGECSTTQTFVATSGIQQPGRLACMASHLTIFAIQQLPWRSVRERTSRLCSDCSAMRQRR